MATKVPPIIVFFLFRELWIKLLHYVIRKPQMQALTWITPGNNSSVKHVEIAAIGKGCRIVILNTFGHNLDILPVLWVGAQVSPVYNVLWVKVESCKVETGTSFQFRFADPLAVKNGLLKVFKVHEQDHLAIFGQVSSLLPKENLMLHQSRHSYDN